MDKNHPTLKTLDTLLRGELSAVETYATAVRCFPELGAHPLLEGIRAAHSRSAGVLRSLIEGGGRTPSRNAVPWSGLVELQENPPKAPLVKSPVIAVFKEGEKRGVRHYEEALDSGNLSESLKAVIRDDLLPRAWQHWLNMESLAA